MNPYVSTEFSDDLVSVTFMRPDVGTLIVTIVDDHVIVTRNEGGTVSQAELEVV